MAFAKFQVEDSLVPRPLSEKSRRGLAAHGHIVPEEFNQSRNRVLMFVYAVKVCAVAWLV